MADTNLPCGCLMQSDDMETTVVFCGQHTLDYIRWDGTDREFIKIIATPSGKADRRALAKMQ
jgi:hypothetical protein